MPKFEVHIPAVETTGFNFTFRVDADNWMAALKMGMRKLGEQGAYGQNVLVDIQDDNSLHVTEPQSGRVFQIRELSDQEAAAATVKTRPPLRRSGPELPMLRTPSAPLEREPRTLQDIPVVTQPPARLPTAEARGLHTIGGGPPNASRDRTSPPPGRPRTSEPPLARSEQTVSSRRATAIAEADNVVELERPTRPVGAIGRSPPRRTSQEMVENVFADVFERVQHVSTARSVEQALYFLLDLALEKIPVESGTVFRADDRDGDLHFAAVRGPAAPELLRAQIIVPAGTGIVGFCATEGVSVALSDVQKDPRYYAAVAARVNYQTRSVLCTPIMKDGRTFGCLQLINKKSTPLFTEPEMGLASYIAHQAALLLATRG